MSKVFTVAQIAQIMQISKPKAYEMVNRPDFPKIMVGRCIRVPEGAFNQWIEREAQGHE